MGLKIFQVSNGCKNILYVKLVYKTFMSQLGVKNFRYEIGVKIFQVPNDFKNILGVKWV